MSDANDSVNPADDRNQASGDDSVSKEDTVKYDTYRKVLSEKKKRDEQLREMQEQLAAFQSREKERTESELQEQNKWKELADLRTEELTKAQAEIASMRGSQQQAMKLDAFLGSLETQLPKQYWGLVNLDAIKLNPDTSEVDEMSVASAVETFRKTYPEILTKKSNANLPTTAPSGTAAATRGEADFKNLPAAERNKILAADLINLQQRRRG